MTANQLKKKYLSFFVKKGHKLLPNVSLIPENDPTALFINSGMHPLIPYLLGEPHPLGKRLVSNQRCLRTQDIEKIGNPSHLTFFEMLGNWSLGDYWKKEAIEWSWEFLTKELNLDPQRITVSCFAGDKDSPKDEESAKIWESVGIPYSRIYFLGKEDNWWSVGETGPCGPDTEMFYDIGKKACGPDCRPGDNCGKYFEIWNNVFMEFNRKPNGQLEKLKQKNIDTGMGVERTTAMLQGKDDAYQTELFSGLINQIEQISGEKYEEKNQRAMRIIVDHLRAATFAMADGMMPSNVEAGYVVRRLIRRAIRYGKLININQAFIAQITNTVVEEFKKDYPHLEKNKDLLLKESEKEEERFRKVIESGLKKSEKIFNQKTPIDSKKYSQLMQIENKKEFFRQIYSSFKGEGKEVEKFDIPLTKQEIAKATISGKEAFDLYQTFGFPIEMIIELAQEKRLLIDPEVCWEEVRKHQELSRANLKKKFAGGLADHSQEVTKLHTATHLLHQALRQILSEDVHQVGSNITPERLRFDFTYPEKLTPKQIKQVEDLVNEQISKDLAVKMEMMSLEKAKKQGALAFFADKYKNLCFAQNLVSRSAQNADQVKVYSIDSFSKEVCGGPHVGSLGEIGSVKIIKEESVGAGRRRIYAQIVKK